MDSQSKIVLDAPTILEREGIVPPNATKIVHLRFESQGMDEHMHVVRIAEKKEMLHLLKESVLDAVKKNIGDMFDEGTAFFVSSHGIASLATIQFVKDKLPIPVLDLEMERDEDRL